MEVVQFLVGTQGVHVGIDATARGNAQLSELQALPLREGVHDLGLLLVQAADRKADRALDAVQVIVDARSGQDRHRRRHAQERELGGEVVLEHVFHGLDGLFGLLDTAEEITVLRGKIE